LFLPRERSSDTNVDLTAQEVTMLAIGAGGDRGGVSGERERHPYRNHRRGVKN